MKSKALLILLAILFSGCAVRDKPVPPTVFYPSLPQLPRIQYLYTFSTEIDLGNKPSAFRQFVLGGPLPTKAIGRPYDIAASKGRIYLTERNTRKILILDLSQKRLYLMPDRRLGKLQNPSGIWVTDKDVKYVADMQRRQVVVFDHNHDFVRAYGGQGRFQRPVDVAQFENTVYVCDMAANSVFALDKSSGKIVRTISTTEGSGSPLKRPTHITVDAEGYLYVNDAFNFRLRKYDPRGNYVRSFGYHGQKLGALARPKGVAVDRGGHLYVADAAFENVQIFNDTSSELLLFFGGPGKTHGSMYLPAGIHIDYLNNAYFERFADKDFHLEYVIYVANMFGPHKVNVYGFGRWIGEPLSSDADIKARLK